MFACCIVQLWTFAVTTNAKKIVFTAGRYCRTTETSDYRNMKFVGLLRPRTIDVVRLLQHRILQRRTIVTPYQAIFVGLLKRRTIFVGPLRRGTTGM